MHSRRRGHRADPLPINLAKRDTGFAKAVLPKERQYKNGPEGHFIPFVLEPLGHNILRRTSFCENLQPASAWKGWSHPRCKSPTFDITCQWDYNARTHARAIHRASAALERAMPSPRHLLPSAPIRVADLY